MNYHHAMLFFVPYRCFCFKICSVLPRLVFQFYLFFVWEVSPSSTQELFSGDSMQKEDSELLRPSRAKGYPVHLGILRVSRISQCWCLGIIMGELEDVQGSMQCAYTVIPICFLFLSRIFLFPFVYDIFTYSFTLSSHTSKVSPL